MWAPFCSLVRDRLLTLSSLDSCHTLGNHSTKYTFRLFYLYKHGSVFSDLTDSITPVHLLFTPLFFHFLGGKKSHCLDISPVELGKSDLKLRQSVVYCNGESESSRGKWDGVGVMKDKEVKAEEVKVPHTLGGSSHILILYINSTKEVVTTSR